MKRNGLILTILIVLLTSVGGLAFLLNTIRTNKSTQLARNMLPGFATINQESIHRDVSYLASNKLQGRLSLTPGDKQAIDWIANRFKEAGLAPAVGKSYLQAVPLIQFAPNLAKSYLSIDHDNKKSTWKNPDIFMEYPQNISLIADVVFAGYGISAPDLKYDDYQSVDVHGKIVLIFEHEPEETNDDSIFNGKANTTFATGHTKALIAQEHGAIAVLIAPEPNRTHPSNQERRARIGGSHERKSPIPSQALVNDELHIPVVVISDKVANKIIGNNQTLSTLQTAIDKKLQPQTTLIAHTTILLNNQNTSRTMDVSYNVAGILEGSDPSLKKETIIISAHHDHDGKSKKDIWHGADDNASGTAGVLALAAAYEKNALAPSGVKPKRSLLFVVFASEERGLLGSFYMAAHPLRPLDTTRAMLNFDMIGRNELPSTQTDGLIEIPKETDNRLNLIGGHYSPDYDKTIIKQNQFIGLTLDHRFDNEAALNVFFRSDQFPFVLHQIPAFWWFTGFHPDYHHQTDTADKINYDKMVKILQLAYLTGYQFADQDKIPTFIKNPKK